MITFTANIRNARAVSDDALTVSSAGVPIKLNLAPEFNGLAKTLTFVNGAISVDLVLQGDPTEAVVPHEVLSVPGQLRIGIYAANPEGTVVIPTIWAQAGRVAPGAAPSGIDPAAPTPNWAAQTQAIAESALEVAESVQTRIDNGDFTDVLWVSYGATTAEVEAAYQTGKVVCMKYLGRNYILTNRVTSTNHCFISALLTSANRSLYYALCSNNNWTSGSISIPAPSSWNPQPLGAAAPGTANLYSRYDHVHKMPSASDVGAIAAPASPNDGDVLTYDSDSDEWVAEAPSGGGAVSSVNGQTGAVVLDAEDVGAYSKPSSGIPKTDLASDVQTSLGKADTALQSAPVSSVNGQTGAVVLDADDVGALPDSYTPPTEVAWFTYGTSTSAQIEAAYQAGKVCLVDYNTRIYVLTVRNSATSHRFSSAIHSNVYTVLCSSDSWSVNNRDIPAVATATPSALGTAAIGSSAKYAKEDHVHETELAWFTRGTSTSAEIEAAYQAGKVCVAISGTRLFWLNRRVSETKHTFVSTSYDQIYTTTCDNNNWTDTNRTVPLKGNGTPQPLGTASAGSSDNVSRQDHVHAMPSASDVGAVAVVQGIAHAGEFVVVGSDGNITTVTMTTWQGGSY